VLSPCTPDAERSDLKLIDGDVGAILFDFDGTLTATPGDSAAHHQKEEELVERAALLEPRLLALREAGITLGIISKSSEATIRGALDSAALASLFDGPIIGKAVGFDGKAGFIEDLVCSGALQHLGGDGLCRVLLIDDDVRELDRARLQGIQTYPAPESGGLRAQDLDEIFSRLGVELPTQQLRQLHTQQDRSPMFGTWDAPQGLWCEEPALKQRGSESPAAAVGGG
jgi:hypothetical protein